MNYYTIFLRENTTNDPKTGMRVWAVLDGYDYPFNSIELIEVANKNGFYSSEAVDVPAGTYNIWWDVSGDAFPTKQINKVYVPNDTNENLIFYNIGAGEKWFFLGNITGFGSKVGYRVHGGNGYTDATDNGITNAQFTMGSVNSDFGGFYYQIGQNRTDVLFRYKADDLNSIDCYVRLPSNFRGMIEVIPNESYLRSGTETIPTSEPSNPNNNLTEISFDNIIKYDIGIGEKWFKIGELKGEGNSVTMRMHGGDGSDTELKDGITVGQFNLGGNNEIGGFYYEISTEKTKVQFLYKAIDLETIGCYVYLPSYFKGQMEVISGNGFSLDEPTIPVANPSGIDLSEIPIGGWKTYETASNENLTRDFVNVMLICSDPLTIYLEETNFKDGDRIKIYNYSSGTITFDYSALTNPPALKKNLITKGEELTLTFDAIGLVWVESYLGGDTSDWGLTTENTNIILTSDYVGVIIVCTADMTITLDDNLGGGGFSNGNRIKIYNLGYVITFNYAPLLNQPAIKKDLTALGEELTLTWDNDSDVWIETYISPGLSNPMTETGDIIYADAPTTVDRLPIGILNDVLTVVDALGELKPAWTALIVDLSTDSFANYVIIRNTAGTDAPIGQATSLEAGVMTTIMHDKLEGIEDLAELNTGVSLGNGRYVFINKVGSEFRFRTLTANDGSIILTQTTNEIDIKLAGVFDNYNHWNLFDGSGGAPQSIGASETASIIAGLGLASVLGSKSITFNIQFSGSGTQNFASRSDHTHNNINLLTDYFANYIIIRNNSGDDATVGQASPLVAGVMTVTMHDKLEGIEDGAEVNVPTDLTTSYFTTYIIIRSNTGTDATVGQASSTNAGVMTTDMHDKLDSLLVPTHTQSNLPPSGTAVLGSTHYDSELANHYLYDASGWYQTA